MFLSALMLLNVTLEETLESIDISSYFQDLSFLDSAVPVFKDIISFFLYAKFFLSKFKALPAVIGSVPSIQPSDAHQVEMYNSRYGG